MRSQFFGRLRNHARASPRRHFGRSSRISAARNPDSDLQCLIWSQKVLASWKRRSSGKSYCSDGSKNPISFGDACGAAGGCESFGGDATGFRTNASVESFRDGFGCKAICPCESFGGDATRFLTNASVESFGDACGASCGNCMPLALIPALMICNHSANSS